MCYLVSCIGVSKGRVSPAMRFAIEKRINIYGRISPVCQRNCIAVVVQNTIVPSLQLKPDPRCNLSCPQQEVQLQSIAPFGLLSQKPSTGRRLNECFMRNFIAAEMYYLQRLYALNIAFIYLL
jgi:hypothetical protein